MSPLGAAARIGMQDFEAEHELRRETAHTR